MITMISLVPTWRHIVSIGHTSMPYAVYYISMTYSCDDCQMEGVRGMGRNGERNQEVQTAR